MQAPNCQSGAKAQGEWFSRVRALEKQSAQACFQTRALFCVTKKISSAPILIPRFIQARPVLLGSPNRWPSCPHVLQHWLTQEFLSVMAAKTRLCRFAKTCCDSATGCAAIASPPLPL
jgi:hypothetical protein